MLKFTAAMLLCVFALCTNTQAQETVQTHSYPKDVFRYPLDLAPSTAGSFGELRPNHFHSGLDFKTNQRTGYPVHAVFDGYVSRLRVQFGGFGNAVYITHPNGFTSVYGHLERFSPEIEKAVRDYQNQQQTDVVDFNLLPFQMPVYKGQVIAWSGNTGASAGPHLHFELRDSETQETINPQLFGLTIPDRVPPTISGIAIYHLDGKPFSENTPREFAAVSGAAGHYRLANPKTFNLSGEIGFGISAIDMNSTSANRNGVYSIELKLDDKTAYTFSVERFAFDQTHAINAYIDYPTFLTSGRWIQKCFIPPGSKISLYSQSINRGLINFNDDSLHKVEYIVKDIAGNTSTLSINVKAGKNIELKPYQPKGTLFHYDKQNELSTDNLKVIIPPGNLYDDVDFTYAVLPRHPGAYSATYRLHNRFTPIHDSYEVWIKPDTTIMPFISKAVIVNATGATEQDGYIKAEAHAFGEFYVKIDTVPPFIRPVNIHSGSNMAGQRKISFRIGDSLSGVKSYSGKIDGTWVLMEWDYKSKILSYTFDSAIQTGKHTFELTVTDAKDNVARYTADFYR